MSRFNAVIAEVGTGPNFTDFPTNQDLNRKVIYSGPDGLYDAVPVPMMQPADVVRYLRGHFPNLIHLFSDPENLDPVVPEPYTSSALLAEEVLRRRDDPSLFEDRKSTRLNSSHGYISYAVFCLKKKNTTPSTTTKHQSHHL